MEKSKLFRLLGIAFALIAIALVVIIAIWGEPGMSLIPVVPVLIAGMFQKKSKENQV